MFLYPHLFFQCFSYNTFENQPTHPLRPILTNNACPLRITAAAGTKLAGTSSLIFVIIFLIKRGLRFTSSLTQCSWIKLALIVQYSLLQPLQSLVVLSIPMWMIILSNHLRISGLVSLYPTNCLIRHTLL